MATKNTTRQVVGAFEGAWEEIPWHVILKHRAHDLAMDKDHTLTYADRDRVSPTTSRNEIVQMYETAYSELAESFVGHLERIEELEGDKSHLNTLLSDQLTYTLALGDRLESTSRQLAGLLLLIEQPVQTPPRRPGANPDQYQAMTPQ